ncbi:hypothetical protein JXA02_08500 [candidate division KSB1 bacterium]|nr:hypothetical protein [candidate division KSB1 bacterium]RQW05325.1 MAG: hypothetical protein EH222_10045 [candidate division KSB1 bacterium]
MREFTHKTIIALAFLFAAVQAEDVDSLIVAFSNPSQPGTVKADMIMGGIKVKTHAGREVIILSKGNDDVRRLVVPAMNFSTLFVHGEKEENKDAPDPEKIKGLQKIQSSHFGINVEERNNVIEINMPPMSFVHQNGNELEIIVPKQTSLQLKSLTGAVQVEDVIGEIEVEAMGGGITLRDVGGTVIANTTGDIEATIRNVAGKPMSFSTFGGDIDVALPANLKADLKLKSHGDIYTDFDTSKRKIARDKAEKKSDDGYEATIEQLTEIPLNGGGQDIEFTNFSGTIYIRKLK